MVAVWTVECAADDPVLVVPWSYEAEGLEVPQGAGASFVDLRENPYDLDHLPEAELYPPLMQALRALNATRSPVFTAKCDAWTLDPSELEMTASQLDCPLPEMPCGFASYVDLVWRERSLFASFHLHEQLLHRLVRHAEPLDHPHAVLECVLRPALVDLTGPQEGFAITLYVKALGPDAPTAYTNWSRALQGVVALIRSKDLAQSRQ
jgi:hypothetical protein